MSQKTNISPRTDSVSEYVPEVALADAMNDTVRHSSTIPQLITVGLWHHQEGELQATEQP